MDKRKNTKFIEDVLSEYLGEEEENDEEKKVLALSQFVVPAQPYTKELFSNGFLVVGGNYFCAVSQNQTANPKREVYRVGDALDPSFYDLATSLATETKAIPILPLTYNIAEKVKEGFGAAGLDECIAEATIPVSELLPGDKEKSKFINILVYRPVGGMADLYDFIANDDHSITDIRPVRKSLNQNSSKH